MIYSKHMFTFLKDLYKNSRDDGLLRHSAAVAYYASFSLPALLLVVFSIVRTILQRSSVEQEILNPVRLYMGDATANILQGAAITLEEQGGHTGWTATIGVVLLVLAAIGLIRELQASLNDIFGTPSSHSTLTETLTRYMKAIIPLVLIGIILSASMIISSVLTLIEKQLSSAIHVPIDALQVSSYFVIFLAVTSIFAVLYSVLPAKHFSFKSIIFSAGGAALCLIIGSLLIGKIAVFTSIGSMYGVAAGLLVLLFWMFFCGNVFFVGAECIDLWSRKID